MFRFPEHLVKMHVITKRRLRDFLAIHPDATASLLAWLRLAEHGSWRHLADVRHDWPSADVVGNFIVCNISGNKYRLIVYMDFARHMIFIRHLLTHAEYDKEVWKHDDWYS